MRHMELYLGDCMDILPQIDNESVDAIITDPPYAKEYTYLYGAIAKEAKRILKPGGSYLAILANYAIPRIMHDVSSHLKYRWTHCMWQENGKYPRLAMGIVVKWKPIGWWVKSAWPSGRGFVFDGFRNNPPNKIDHCWEQSEDWAGFCLNIVPSGGVVLDPLMGTGTVGVECMRNGYDFIGIDIDDENYNLARARILKERDEDV